MDTSKKYIEMCKKSIEIQKMPIRRVFSRFCLDTRFYYSDTGEIYYCAANYDRPSEEDVWLPRQDQLQEMMPNKPVNCFAIVERLNNFIKWEKNGRLSQSPPKSIEQLWLMFIMSGYGKFWNGKEWEGKS